MKESTLSKNYIEWLNSLPWTYAEKRLAGPGRKGRPDITGCSHGFRLEIEVKVYDNKPTEFQIYWLKKWQSSGAIAFWGNSLEDLQTKFINAMMEKGFKI
jgi:hypothetical protein